MKQISLLAVAAMLAVVTVSVAKPETVDHGAAAHKSSHFKDGVHNPVFDHEALFGSRNSDDLDELPTEVKQRRLYTLAKSHDINDDNIIDAEELKAWVLQSFKLLDQEETNDRFPDDDENSDGQVSMAELIHKAYGYTEEDIANMKAKDEAGSSSDGEDDETAEVLRLIKDDEKRFEAADLDKDNFLSKSEYAAYLQPYDYEYMSEVEMERALNDMDTDKDGLIVFEEFTGGELEDEEARLSEQTNFDELDKDKDGKLNKEELRPWAMPDNADVATEEVEHLMEECDENKDGHLSVDEIVSKEEEFLSSSATDYGRHLHFVRDEL